MRRCFWRRQLGRRLNRAASDVRGVAAIEFSLIAVLLVVALLNTVDVARYFYMTMEVQNAAQIAGQAAWKTCDVSHLPATTNCPGLNHAITGAIQASSLGSGVTLANGSPSEGYYCVNRSGSLVYVSSVSSKPSNCSSVGSASDQPGDYIQVQVSYAYAPLFPGVSVGGTLTTPVTSTALMRLQ